MKSPLDVHGLVVESNKFEYVSRKNHAQFRKIYVIIAYEVRKIHKNCNSQLTQNLE